ncbi:MAG TPA: hypothetical protein VHX63_05150 [Acidobacteriaceae bacterium]|jgi:hypothetical protein|nr:hypothetical protein [Acidobacteriaceae bacterium]
MVATAPPIQSERHVASLEAIRYRAAWLPIQTHFLNKGESTCPKVSVTLAKSTNVYALCKPANFERSTQIISLVLPPLLGFALHLWELVSHAIVESM